MRAAHVIWSMMNEPGVEDVLDVQLARSLPSAGSLDFSTAISTAMAAAATLLPEGDNLNLERDQVAVLVDDPAGLEIL